MNMVNFVQSFNNVLWNYILLIVLIGCGVYTTIKLKFPQFTRLFPAMAQLIRDIKNDVEVEEGEMTPFQSLSTAVAAQVGTGNIIGVATAVAMGGPGAAFWMIISGFFGMTVIFSEAVLAQKYRGERAGEVVGGPAYYIQKGLKNKKVSKFLSYTFAVLCIFALGVVGVMVQSNAVVTSFRDSLGINPLISAVVLVGIVSGVILGGANRIGKFTEMIVPTMAVLYILGGLITVVLNIDLLIPVLRDIVVGAFKPEAIYGGALGIGMQTAIRFGLARGLFSNEAGMGSTPHSHAIAKTDHPVKQGFIAMIGVFMSTFVICLTTVMMNLMSGSYGQYVNGEINQIIMTQTGFSNVFGSLGGPFLSIALAFFSLTTIVGWSFFAEANVKFITSNKWVLRVFRLVVFGALFAGQYISGEFVWELADMAMGMMALPNIIALFFLTKDVVEVYNDYKYKENNGLELMYDYNITINPDTKTLG